MYKIMIVDDEKWIRKSLQEEIDWEGLNLEMVGEAANGEEAFELALKVKPDIVLTDVKMPYMDGLKLMELLHSNIEGIKTIVISGYSEFDLVKQAMVNKAVNYILKP